MAPDATLPGKQVEQTASFWTWFWGSENRGIAAFAGKSRRAGNAACRERCRGAMGRFEFSINPFKPIR